MRRFFILLLCVVIVSALVLAPLGEAQAAGSVTGADMIALINDWRASYWPNSLIEDPTLSACAQWTAETMNANGYSGHLTYYGYQSAGERCPGHGNVTENWAMHYSMDIGTLAYYWSDHDHMLPATDQQYTTVGVGISGNYYVLQAGTKMGDGSSTNPGTSLSDTTQSDATQDLSNYKNPIITSTPNADGSIYHVVQSGQFLYDLATYYGVGYETIKTLNALTGDDIYAGDKLLIRLAPTVTITPTRTTTVQMPTRTQTPTSLPTTPRPTRTMTPTPDPNGGGGLPEIDRQWVGLGLLILSAMGFFVVFYFLFLRPVTKKSPPAASIEEPKKSEEKTSVITSAKPIQKPAKKTTAPSTGSPAKKAVRKTKTDDLVDEPKKVVRKTKAEPESAGTKKTVRKKKASAADDGTVNE